MIPLGKPGAQLLRSLLDEKMTDSAVVLGPAIGVDAAAIDVSDSDILLASSDPVTLASADPARYALAVNANDIAVMGGTPRWFLATVLLPEGSTEDELAVLFTRLREECRTAGVSLVGGHTEVTAAVNHIVIAGTMLGTVTRDGLLTAKASEEGDDLWLAGSIAVEGTAILCTEAAAELLAHGVPMAIVEAGQRLIEVPGISVVAAARLAAPAGARAMHDPTEGGIYGALAELAAAAGRHIAIEPDKIPVLDETRIVCAALGLDPRGLLASGALLIVASPGRRSELSAAFERANLALTRIGVLGEAMKGGLAIDSLGQELPDFERDELARYAEGRSRADAAEGV